MSKIGVISDTHDMLRDEVVEILKGCDYIIHSGDICNQTIFQRLESIAPLYAVRGNNDFGKWAKSLKGELYFEIDGISFYMVHDRNSIPYYLDNVDIIIYGHSHKYSCEMIDNVLWLNPGNCGRKRFFLDISMAVLDISDGRYRVMKQLFND